jgi:hypothetical protein
MCYIILYYINYIILYYINLQCRYPVPCNSEAIEETAADKGPPPENIFLKR